MADVAIVDYGTGNIHSVGRMLTLLGVEWVHTREEMLLRAATHLLMPGVGHCAHAMHSLTETGTSALLSELVLREGVPILGICLGMQLMTKRSAEGDTQCLGWFDAETARIAPVDTKAFKVPNIGWHTVEAETRSQAFAGIDLAMQPFYFCHAYAVDAGPGHAASATFGYGKTYVAALERDNLMGVQFHPEKSQEAGLAMMRNFLGMGRRDV